MVRGNFMSAVMEARPGDKIVYHTGFLMKDRQVGPKFDLVQATAMAAYMLMEQGVVTLFQRKLPDTIFGYEYIAVKLAPPHKPVEWVGCYMRDKFAKRVPVEKLNAWRDAA